jgi:hypothetical protein
MQILRCSAAAFLIPNCLLGALAAQSRPMAAEFHAGALWRDSRGHSEIQSPGLFLGAQWSLGLGPHTDLTTDAAVAFFPGEDVTVLCPAAPTPCGPFFGGNTKSVNVGVGVTLKPVLHPVVLSFSVLPTVHWFYKQVPTVKPVAPAILFRLAATFNPTRRIRPVLSLAYERLASRGPGPGPHWLTLVGIGVEGW